MHTSNRRLTIIIIFKLSLIVVFFKQLSHSFFLLISQQILYIEYKTEDFVATAYLYIPLDRL